MLEKGQFFCSVICGVEVFLSSGLTKLGKRNLLSGGWASKKMSLVVPRDDHTASQDFREV